MQNKNSESQVLSKILRDSWGIYLKHYTALTTPSILVFILSITMISCGGNVFGNIISFIYGPIITIGLHRVIFRFTAFGITPSFMLSISEGCDYWWRGLKVSILATVYLIILFACIALPIGLSLLLKERDETLGLVLLVISSILSIGAFLWFIARACLYLPAMADDRISAVKAFNAGWSLTKGKVLDILRLGLSLFGITLITTLCFGVIIIIVYNAKVEDSYSWGRDCLLCIIGIFAFLASFVIPVYSTVVINLTYQMLKMNSGLEEKNNNSFNDNPNFLKG